MPRLCCFLHPEYSQDESRSLDDRCPQCGKAFGFPIQDSPNTIGKYQSIKPLDRGYYSVAYLAESGPFRRNKVLKLAFASAYKFFGKDFERECIDHSRIANGSSHIVGIDDMALNVSVEFAGEQHLCHIAELDFVEGKTLSSVLASENPVSARTIAQIAIDLFSILRELENKGFHHNDLQPANLIVQNLSPDNRRADAEDETVRLVAIDLNSASDMSKSDPDGRRFGDLHWVASYLKLMTAKLLAEPDKTADIEYRLASVLEERSSLLSPDSLSQRTPTFDECIEDIRTAVRRVSSPWLEPRSLTRFNDAYNAQTLHACFVPHLIVDPNDRWLASIATPGPQVITGMRGCGKTMLLRALQFHARATIPEERKPNNVLERLKEDQYLGLYASSTRLLDSLGVREESLLSPHVRLFIQYAIESLRSIQHLREIDRDSVVAMAYEPVGLAVASHVQGAEQARAAGSEYELLRFLLNYIIKVSRGELKGEFTGHLSSAFSQLAEATTQASEVWRNKTVFYLLDDVSTRYLGEPSIKQLMSALIFSDPRCAFKLTTEAQTLEMILRSPGQIELAREGRDYQVFDLGAEVNDVIRSRGEGKRFVEDVLAQRAKYFPHHPDAKPSQVLGDTSLESIAELIATTSENSSRRKQAYHGVSALAGVCVGDIGEVISLYELMLRKSSGKVPIPAKVQSESFQQHCSRRLYDLNRRNGWLKDHALAFADAAHLLLMKSENDLRTGKIEKQRLRQYARLYVRVTTGDMNQQFDKIRELIDAGVFVLDSGGAPRTKTRDSNPVQQFNLTYRKIYGIANFIGLSERDRFEISGDDLIRWLLFPAEGKAILVRNLASSEDLVAAEEMDSATPPDSISDDTCIRTTQNESSDGSAYLQQILFEGELETEENESFELQTVEKLTRERSAKASQVSLSDLHNVAIDNVVLGLGFEERTLESFNRIRQVVKPKNALIVKYSEEGRSSDIMKGFWPDVEATIMDYDVARSGGFVMAPGNTLIDITGLAKPIIFSAVRSALQCNGKVWICRTKAKVYYPLDEDIEKVIAAETNASSGDLLDSLSKILTGEFGPYVIDPLLPLDSDESRRRVLLAFSSPKHERLLKLLDERAYDAGLVVAHHDNSPRATMSRIAAEIASRNYSGMEVTTLASDDLHGVMSFIASSYQEWYVQRGCNFEFGLTGSKLQAVACAAASVCLKASQCWYVRPSKFDPARFTSGVGESIIYEVATESSFNSSSKAAT